MTGASRTLGAATTHVLARCASRVTSTMVERFDRSASSGCSRRSTRKRFARRSRQKYGPVADARSGSVFSLGWGPAIDSSLVYDRSGPRTALTAHYTVDSDFMREGLNEADDVRLILALVDAEWAAKSRR